MRHPLGARATQIASGRGIIMGMTAIKRSTIYFDAKVHRAVRRKAAAVDASISDVVNDAVRRSLLEDAEDVKTFVERRDEPTVSFEKVVRSMKRRGKL